MRTSRSMVLVVAAALVGVRAEAITLGSCTSNVNGTARVSGAFTPTGSGSVNSTTSGGMNACQNNVGAAQSGSNSGYPFYFAAANLISNPTGSATSSSGGGYVLSGSATLSAIGEAYDGTTSSNKGPTVTAFNVTGGDLLHQQFYIGPGETVAYQYTVIISGGENSYSYSSLFYQPTYTAKLLQGGQSIANLSLPGSIPQGDNLNLTYMSTGTLTNTTNAAELFDMVSGLNVVDFSGAAYGYPFGNPSGSGDVQYNYTLALTPVPLPPTVWLLASALGCALLVVVSRRDAPVSAPSVSIGR